MKLILAFCLLVITLLSCNNNRQVEQKKPNLVEGTWQLVLGVIIEKGDTAVTDYTKGRQMIKMINSTHFAFLNHDLAKGKDSTSMFAAGGGRYELRGDQYTEYLEYCSDRVWEGNIFRFTVKIQNDTLTQSGVEKVEGTAVNRLNIERYVRVHQSGNQPN